MPVRGEGGFSDDVLADKVKLHITVKRVENSSVEFRIAEEGSKVVRA